MRERESRGTERRIAPLGGGASQRHAGVVEASRAMSQCSCSRAAPTGDAADSPQLIGRAAAAVPSPRRRRRALETPRRRATVP